MGNTTTASVTGAQVAPAKSAIKDLPIAKVWAFAVGQFGWALLSGIISNWLVYFYQPDQETISQGQTVFVPQGLVVLGIVPVVGGILSDATETVLTGASAIRSGIGIFGTLVILGFCVVPFLYLGVQYLVYKLVAMLASVLYQGAISDLIDQIGAAFGLVLGMLGSCALLVLISLIGTISVAMT